jgi:hypothetical protein
VVGGKFQGQVVGISRSIGGGNYQGQVVGEIIKVKWWGYQGQLVGEIIKVKWWGYLGQVVGISRPSGGDIKVRGRGLEVKVKKKWWGVRALSNSLYLGQIPFFFITISVGWPKYSYVAVSFLRKHFFTPKKSYSSKNCFTILFFRIIYTINNNKH